MINSILFVCTGNTCRSPMAEAFMKNNVLKNKKLRSSGIEVTSAGFYPSGLPAPREAASVMHGYGLDITGHRSRTLDQDMLDMADLVLVMSQEHREDIHDQFNVKDGKIHLLSEYVGDSGDIPDPWQRGPEAYRECAALLRSMLEKLATKLLY